jgi:flagellar biosynthetic protein FliR
VFSGSIVENARLLTLAAARTVPLALAIPVLGGPTFPLPLRLALGVGLAVLCLPVLSSAPAAVGELGWGLLAAREVLVGVVMGFVVASFFRAAEAAGELTDVLRGSDTASASSLLGGGQSSPLGSLFLLLAAVAFLETGGLGHLALALARSYEAIPLAAPMAEVYPRTAAMVVILASGKLIEAAVGLAAPVMVALVLVDVAFGIIARVVPRLPLPVVAVPTRALLGLAVVLLGLGSLDLALQQGWRGFLGLLAAAFDPGR